MSSGAEAAIVVTKRKAKIDNLIYWSWVAAALGFPDGRAFIRTWSCDVNVTGAGRNDGRRGRTVLPPVERTRALPMRYPTERGSAEMARKPGARDAGGLTSKSIPMVTLFELIRRRI